MILFTFNFYVLCLSMGTDQICKVAKSNITMGYHLLCHVKFVTFQTRIKSWPIVSKFVGKGISGLLVILVKLKLQAEMTKPIFSCKRILFLQILHCQCCIREVTFTVDQQNTVYVTHYRVTIFMAAILLCSLLNQLHLFSLTQQHVFILIQIVTFTCVLHVNTKTNYVREYATSDHAAPIKIKIKS